jgi:hypothetical protein
MSEKDSSFEKNSFFTQNPGWLIQRGNLLLHTHIGVYYGRKLLQMTERLRTLRQAAQDDNPYADHYLLQLEEMMLTIYHEFDLQEREYQQRLIQFPDIYLELVANQKPLSMDLHF